MKLLNALKARLPRLSPVLLAVAVVGSAGGYAAYQHFNQDCCELGGDCCYPGSPCCLAPHHKAEK